jgi:hypothetical protein
MSERRLDIVVATDDRTLRRVAVSVLANEGHAVTPTRSNPLLIHRVVDQRRPEVLVLDGGPADAERVGTMLRDGGLSTGLAVVSPEVGGPELIAAVLKAATAADAEVTRPRRPLRLTLV